MNRDLTRRVRNVNGLTQHKQILRNDIKLAAKLIHTLDDHAQLWGGGEPRPATEVSVSCRGHPFACWAPRKLFPTSGFLGGPPGSSRVG